MFDRGRYRNQVVLLDYAALSELCDYSIYKPRAITYLASNTKLEFSICLKFFEELDKTKSSKLDKHEKLLLAKKFVHGACQCESRVDPASFIYWVCKLKDELGENYFSLLFDSAACVEVDLDVYISLCQLLLDLGDEIDTEMLLIENLTNIPELISLLKQKRGEVLLRKYPEKNIDDVISEFKQSKFVQFPLPSNEIDQLKEDYLNFKGMTDELRNLDLDVLQQQAKSCGQALKDNVNNKIKLIAIICEVIRRVFKIYPYNTQVLALLALINNPSEYKGRIAQIRTGEGKSMIIAMHAAFSACQGKFVDVITTARYLAIRDQSKYAKFYETLGITSSHICYDQQVQHHFNGQVIYTTHFDSAFSVLNDMFYDTNLRYTHLNDKLVAREVNKSFAITDEFDLSMDAALNSTRIAIQASTNTTWVYEPILRFVQEKGKGCKKDPDAVNQLRSVLAAYQDRKLNKQAELLSDKQLLAWIQSACKAQFKLRLNRDYVIGFCKTKRKPQILIVDFENTGRVNTSSRWSYGIHEFLEVKNGIAPEEQSCTFAAISHPALLNMYGENDGLTGTGGEEDERNEIKAVYHSDVVDIPTQFPNQREMKTPLYFATREEYYRAILANINEAKAKGQPSLIVFDSIEDSIEFSNFLNENEINHQLLNDVQNEDENHIVNHAGMSGVITICTNVGGRGTDIILTPESKKAGGLNLLLGFYPINKRVEDQALGRAGRQGNPGTCRLITYTGDRNVKKFVQSEAERHELLDDPAFKEKLDRYRAEHTALLSKKRTLLSQIEIIHFNLLQQFAEILSFFKMAVNNLPLEKLVSYFKKIDEPSASSEFRPEENPVLYQLKKQFHELIGKQILGVNVDWSHFINNRIKKNYILYVQQKWAQFFSELDDKQNQMPTDPSRYQPKIERIFYQFMNTAMRSDMENPANGFIQFINKTLQVDIDISSLGSTYTEKSRIFAMWQRNILPDLGSANVANNGMFVLKEKNREATVVNHQIRHLSV